MNKNLKDKNLLEDKVNKAKMTKSITDRLC